MFRLEIGVGSGSKTSPPTRSVVYIDANHLNYAVMRRDLRDGRTELLAQGYGSATTPRPSPDGRRIAFVRRVQNRTVLFTYDLDTRQQLPVFEGQFGEFNGHYAVRIDTVHSYTDKPQG